MDKKTIKNFVVGSALLLLAALIFLTVESRGRLAESRFGIIAIVVIAVLLFFAAFLSKDEKPATKPTPAPADANPAPKVDAAAPAPGTDSK